MLRAIKNDSQAFASELEYSAFEPADWDMWVLVNSEQAAMHVSTLLCKYFKDVLLDSLRMNKEIRRKRVYTVVKASDCAVPMVVTETPYPARLTGIALGERSGAAAVEMCESQLIEALRPCINATIQALDERLSQASMGRIFVTGGDAMRRFDSGIRVSKDIDTKIYVPPGQHLDDVVSLATELVGKAVTIMVKERAQLLPRNIERVINGTPVGFMYRIRDDDNLQFRLRYLPKEPNGRPRLVSINYRMKVRVGSLEFNQNIPVLDVVVQRAPKSTDPREASTKPPIAGLPWLVDDIKHTWQSSSRAKQRVWAGKRAKNLDRLQELQRRLDAGRSAREGNLGRVNMGVLEYLRDSSKAPLIL
ncbi:hypothetical protein KFL_013560030, partial [Klebsormidium nitens]